MVDHKSKIGKGIASHYLSNNIDDVRSNLREKGIDLEKESKEKQQFIKRMKFLTKAKINQEKDNVLLEKVSRIFIDALNDNLEKPISYLKSLAQNNQFAVQYRNLDKLDINEIKNIIKDQNLLDILEKLEDEEK